MPYETIERDTVIAEHVDDIRIILTSITGRLHAMSVRIGGDYPKASADLRAASQAISDVVASLRSAAIAPLA